MGRPKVPSGYSIACWPKPLPISGEPRDVGDPDGRREPSYREELIEIAGLERHPRIRLRMLQSVEARLGEYPHAVRILDDRPRPASVALALQIVIDTAMELLVAMFPSADRLDSETTGNATLSSAALAFYQALKRLDHASRRELFGAPANRKRLEDTALWLCGAAPGEDLTPVFESDFAADVLAFAFFLGGVRDRLRERGSRGRQRRKAFGDTVDDLHSEFHRHARIDAAVFERTSHFDDAEDEPPLHTPRLAADFIAAALDAAGIPRPRGTQPPHEDQRRYELDDLLRTRRR